MQDEDPFTLVQEDVSAQLVKVTAQMSRWKELMTSSSDMDATEANQIKANLTSMLGELEQDVQDMQTTVDIAAKEPSKFGIEQSELNRRREFVFKTRSEIAGHTDTLSSFKGAARLAKTARKERIERQGLLANAPQHRVASSRPVGLPRARCAARPAAPRDPRAGAWPADAEPPLRGAAAQAGSSSSEMATDAASSVEALANRSAQQRDVYQQHDQVIQEQQQIREAVVAEQDKDLGVLSNTMFRLGEMGRAIKDELIAQGKALDELTEDVDATQGRLKQATAVMNKMLASKDRGKFCMIIVLTIVLILLFYFVIA